jgi:hypothetical protein
MALMFVSLIFHWHLTPWPRMYKISRMSVTSLYGWNVSLPSGGETPWWFYLIQKEEVIFCPMNTRSISSTLSGLKLVYVYYKILHCVQHINEPPFSLFSLAGRQIGTRWLIYPFSNILLPPRVR